MPREGILVHSVYERLDRGQIERIHSASMEILHRHGIMCYNRETAEIFSSHGAEVTTDPASGC